MKARLLALGAFFVMACGGTKLAAPVSTASERTAAPSWQPGRSYVWRVTTSTKTRFGDDTKEQVQESKGELVVDVLTDGKLRVQLPNEAVVPLEGVEAWLPAGEPGRRVWTVPGMGSTSTNESPDMVVEEATTRAPDGTVTVVRESKAASASYRGSTTMKGTAARTSGVPHFGSVIWTFTSVADTSPKGAHDEAVHFDVSGTISVQYDAERSAARLGERAEIASRARHAARGFDAYLARNGAKEEIARALAETPADLTMEIAKKRPAYIVTLSFHLRRNPEDVAAALFAARPDPDALPWFLRRSCEVSHGFPVAIAKHAPVPSARHLLAGCADERVRPALVAIAKGKDDLATTAKKTLASLDALKTPSKAFARNADESLVARGNDIMMAAILNDRRALVPALIAELEREPDTAAQWLEALTLAPLGKDPNAWRAFWATHEKLPASAWALEAAASPVATIRAVAYGVLATLPATEETRAVVARGLDDPRPRVKLAAAIALVSLGDDRGVAPLLALLEQGAAGERETALVALAPRMPVTFGFDPRAPEAERAEALARIRVWAEREGLRFP